MGAPNIFPKTQKVIDDVNDDRCSWNHDDFFIHGLFVSCLTINLYQRFPVVSKLWLDLHNIVARNVQRADLRDKIRSRKHVSSPPTVMIVCSVDYKAARDRCLLCFIDFAYETH